MIQHNQKGNELRKKVMKHLRILIYISGTCSEQCVNADTDIHTVLVDFNFGWTINETKHVGCFNGPNQKMKESAFINVGLNVFLIQRAQV